MVRHQRIAEAASSKWKWLIRCWRLRLESLELVNAFNASPTHVELEAVKSELALAKSELSNREAKLEVAHESREDLEQQFSKAEDSYKAEYAALKEKYDKRLRAKESDQLEAVKTELLAERDAKHLLRIELQDARKKLADHLEEHKLARDGNRALLRFIHTRHRLNVKFDPGTIRESLQRADLKK